MANNDLQQRFYAGMADPQQFLALFEQLPGVFFLVKDLQGRFITANAATRERLGAKDLAAFVGTTDADYIANELVQDFRQDDAQVIRTRKPLLNRLEAWIDEQGQLQWFQTTKLPVMGRRGKPIGVMAIIRRYDERRASPTVGEAADAVAYVRANLRRALTTAELAHAIGVSQRNLHRKLNQAMGVTPHELMLRLRIEAAGERLATSHDTIAKIALDHGFYDQSAFTKHFRQRTGLTPRAFRLRHQG